VKKILVIGAGGSGKTDLALRLGKILGLPVYHLDKLFWKPGWVKPGKPVWKQTVAELVSRDQWVIDGNYGGTFDIRFPAADTIIFLNYNRFLCLYRVIKRWLKYYHRTRPDLTEGCIEKIDLPFLNWIWTYPGKRVPGIREMFKTVKAEVIELRNPRDTKEFINKLSHK
jgi:adenylate kinase family enzyme